MHKNPNILFINTDQWAYPDISILGLKGVKTPVMDRLIQRSTSFHYAYTTNPVCMPARTNWFTGRYSHETKTFTNNDLALPKGFPDMGHWFRRHGYDTFHTGKWHVNARDCSESFTILSPDPRNIGVDYDMVTARSVRGFLENYRGDKPFFLAAGILNPHDICHFGFTFDPNQDLTYPEIESLPELPANFSDWSQESSELTDRRTFEQNLIGATSETRWRFYIWMYHRYIEMADASLGIILDALFHSKFHKNTLIVCTSDHGECRGEHGLPFKSVLYEAAVRVPFTLTLPNSIPEGKIDRDHLISHVDIFPTVCDYAGIPSPRQLPGLSLKKLFDHPSTPWRDHILAHACVFGTQSLSTMIRTFSHKYIRYSDSSVENFFDMVNDPFEKNDIIGNSNLSTEIDKLRDIFKSYEPVLNTEK